MIRGIWYSWHYYRIEEELTMKRMRVLLAGACGLLVSCAIITVNVYFPEKAVKDAYKSVDEMMLKGDGDKPALPETPPSDNNEQAPGAKPLSGIFRMLPAVAFVSTA